MKLTTPAEGAALLVAGRSTGHLRWVAAGAETRPGGETSVATLGSTNTNAQIVLTPLAKQELASLGLISAATARVAIPAAHIESLLATGDM